MHNGILVINIIHVRVTKRGAWDNDNTKEMVTYTNLGIFIKKKLVCSRDNASLYRC